MTRVFLAILISCSASLGFAEAIDRIVAVVNSEIVTESDLRSFAKKVEQNGMIDDLLLFGQKPAALKGNRQGQLDYLITEKLLDSEIKRLNLVVTVERVEQEIRDVAKRNGASRADLMSAIKAQGINASDYQDFIKTRIERQSLIEQEISSKIRVSDEDVMAQLARQSPASVAGISEFTLAHILFLSKNGGAAAARIRAENLLKKIRAGESFDILAEQNSEDPNFTTGGLLGTFKAGEFNKELETAVQFLGAGDVSGVVQTKSGFQIVKVVSKKMTADPKLEKEKEKIRSALFEQAFQKHFKNWLGAKREDSFVKIN